MKATKQYFPVVLLIMLSKLVLTLESVDVIFKCDHSNESHCAILSCGTVLSYCVRCDRQFYRLSLSVDKILQSDYSNESY